MSYTVGGGFGKVGVLESHRKRGFEKISESRWEVDSLLRVHGENDVPLPSRKTIRSAGHDIPSTFDFELNSGNEILIGGQQVAGGAGGAQPLATPVPTAVPTPRPDDEDEDGEIPEVVFLPIEDLLDLHAFRPEDVESVVQEYLEECRRRVFGEIRIIHGKGIGVQREIVHALLRRSPHVSSFRLAAEEAGGWGATIVQLLQLGETRRPA